MNQDGLDHGSQGGIVIMACVISAAIATIATGLRLFTRLHINHQVGIDDWFAIISLVKLPIFSLAWSHLICSNDGMIYVLLCLETELTGIKMCAIGMAISQSINASKYLGRHQYDLNMAVDFPAFLAVSVEVIRVQRRD
jgi:hypothetical protein